MKTDWKDDIFTQRKIRLTENSDGTVTPVDATTYTQNGDSFGAKELNEIGTEINEVKKSVSDGKALVAAAITAKRVATAATDTFAKMAENIKKIVLGSGNAQPADVRKGKTFTNDEGIEKAGTMPEYISGTKGISCGLNDSGLYYYMGAGYWIQDGSGKSWVYMSRDEVAAAIGLNPDCMLDSINVLGKQGKIQSMAGVTVTPQTYAQTVWSAWKRMSGNVEIAAVPLPPANAIKKGYRYWIGGSYVDGQFEGYVTGAADIYRQGAVNPNYPLAMWATPPYEDSDGNHYQAITGYRSNTIYIYTTYNTHWSNYVFCSVPINMTPINKVNISIRGADGVSRPSTDIAFGVYEGVGWRWDGYVKGIQSYFSPASYYKTLSIDVSSITRPLYIGFWASCENKTHMEIDHIWFE